VSIIRTISAETKLVYKKLHSMDDIIVVDNLDYNLTKTVVVIIVVIVVIAVVNPYVISAIASLLPASLCYKRRQWYAFLIAILILFIVLRLILI